MSDFDDWRAETVRYTVFPDDPKADVPDWKAITGEEPESRNSQPRLGVTVESDVWGDTGGKLVLQIERARAHLRISSELGDGVGAGDLGLPAVEAALADLQTFAKPWLPALPTLSRVAFGAVLFRAVASRQAGYKLLDQYLPAVTVDPDDSQDFLYRINRRRDVDVGGDHTTTVNRLSTWSVLGVNSLIVKMGEAAAGEIQTATSVYHLRLELDISTLSEEGAQFPTDPKQFPGMFDRLVALGAEIADQGDIA